MVCEKEKETNIQQRERKKERKRAQDILTKQEAGRRMETKESERFELRTDPQTCSRSSTVYVAQRKRKRESNANSVRHHKAIKSIYESCSKERQKKRGGDGEGGQSAVKKKKKALHVGKPAAHRM